MNRLFSTRFNTAAIAPVRRRSGDSPQPLLICVVTSRRGNVVRAVAGAPASGKIGITTWHTESWTKELLREAAT